MSARIDLSGRRFGRLRVEGYSHSDKHKRAVWKCVCDCGKTAFIVGDRLRKGETKSCGCLWKEKNTGITREQGKQSKLYHIWSSIKQRCLNPKNKSYPYYGGKGVRVCSEWLEFQPFLEWAMRNGYKPGLTIDRKDNEKGYTPQNCHWVSRQAQSLNRDFKKRPHRGVIWDKAKKKWQGRVFFKYRLVFNKYFDSLETAISETEKVRYKYFSNYKEKEACQTRKAS